MYIYDVLIVQIWSSGRRQMSGEFSPQVWSEPAKPKTNTLIRNLSSSESDGAAISTYHSSYLRLKGYSLDCKH